MLRNNAVARRCSYFELGLPVVYFEILRLFEQEMKASLVNDLCEELRIE